MVCIISEVSEVRLPGKSLQKKKICVSVTSLFALDGVRLEAIKKADCSVRYFIYKHLNHWTDLVDFFFW